MTFKKKILVAALLVCGISSVFAANSGSGNTVLPDTVFNSAALKNAPETAKDPKRFVIPTNGIIALEVDNKVQLLSSNGRYIIQGNLYDTWAKKPLHTLDDIKQYATIIPLNDLKLNVADLQPAVWGNGPKKVLVFTDPNCTFCHDLLKELADLDPHQYTVNVLSLGALGEQSQKRNLELYCASDRYRADRAIIASDKNIRFEQVKNCDRTALVRRTITAQVLGVSMVPFVIRDDGVYTIGKPNQGLKKFLAGQ